MSLLELCDQAAERVSALRQQIVDLRRQAQDTRHTIANVNDIASNRSHTQYLPFFRALLCMSIAHAHTSRRIPEAVPDDDRLALKDYRDGLATLRRDAPPRYSTVLNGVPHRPESAYELPRSNPMFVDRPLFMTMADFLKTRPLHTGR